MHTPKEYSESSLGLRLHDLSPRRVSPYNGINGGLPLPPSLYVERRQRGVSLGSGTRSLSVGRTSLHGTSGSSVQNRYGIPLPRMQDHDPRLKEYGKSNNVQRYGRPMFSRPNNDADSVEMMEYANVNAVLSRLSILPMEMKGFLHGTSLKEKLKTIRKTLDDNRVSCTSELDAWKDKWKRESIHRRLHPEQKNSRSSDSAVCSSRQVNTANSPSSMRWRGHHEGTAKQGGDRIWLQNPDQSRDPSQFQPQDHGRQVHIQLQNRDATQLHSRNTTQLHSQDRIHLQSRDHIRLEIQDQIRLEIRDYAGRQSRDQARSNSRDQIPLQTRHQSRLQPQDQTRLQTHILTRLQSEVQTQPQIQVQDKKRDQSQSQAQDQTRNQSQGQAQDQTCNQSQVQSQDQARNQCQGQAPDQSREQLQELTRDHQEEKLRDDACDKIQDQPTNEQKVERLPYSYQSRDQSFHQSDEKLRYHIGDLEDKIESLPYSRLGQNKDQPLDHTGEKIDYGHNIECLPYSDSDESRDQIADQMQEQTLEECSYEQLIESLLYSDSGQSGLPYRNQTHDETVELVQEQSQDCPGQQIECLHYSDFEWTRNKVRDQSSSDQSRDRTQNSYQAKIRDEARTETNCGQKIGCLPYRRQSAEQLRNQTQEQTQTMQKIECLPRLNQSRMQGEEQFQQNTSFMQMFEHADYVDPDQSNSKSHLYLKRIIDGSRKEFALRTFEKFVHSRLTHYMLMYITACAKGLMGDEKTNFLSLFKVEGAFKHKPLNEGTYCELLRFVDGDSSPSKDVVKALDVAETSLLEEGISKGYDLKAIGNIRAQMRAFVSLGRPVSSFVTGPPINEDCHDDRLFTVELLQDLIRAADQAKLGALQGLHKLIKLACFLALKGMDSSSSSD